MKRLSCLLLGILLVFSLCACQQAAPSSGEAPDQQAITEEATEYFNQMMDGDFETFFNALPQGVQDNISAETIQETWEEEVDKLGGLPQNTCLCVQRSDLPFTFCNYLSCRGSFAFKSTFRWPCVRKS